MSHLDEAVAWHATVEDSRPRLIAQTIDGAIRPPHVALAERVRSGLELAVHIVVRIAQLWHERIGVVGAHGRGRQGQPRAVKVDPMRLHIRI